MTKYSVTASDAKNRFAELIDSARSEPVTVTRNNRAVAVLLSPEEFTRLAALEDSYWGKKASAVKKTDFLTPSASKTVLTALLHETDSSL